MIATHRASPPMLLRNGAGFRAGSGNAPEPAAGNKLLIQNVSFWYGALRALFDVTLPIAAKSVTAFIGPSGCGKSTLLRLMNRLHEFADGAHSTGEILLDGEDICRPRLNVVELRRRVGMVFQKSNPFPMTIYDNVAFGPRSGGVRDRRRLDAVVERCLVQAALWDEVKDRLGGSALDLSGGQQQRLCIARSLATDPEVLLMDEPASALDPKSTQAVEDLIKDLAKNYTIVLVTHNMQQAARVADVTAFFFEGQLIEVGATAQIFGNPREQKTEEYITGRFG